VASVIISLSYLIIADTGHLLWPCPQRPVRCFNTELVGVLGDQSLPASELHGIGAGDAAQRHTREEPIKDVEADVPSRGAPRHIYAMQVTLLRNLLRKGHSVNPSISDRLQVACSCLADTTLLFSISAVPILAVAARQQRKKT